MCTHEATADTYTGLLLVLACFVVVVTLGYDVDPRLHGNSSGYHSDDATPTRKSEGAPIQEFRMPGMLDSLQENQSRKIVQPSDVVIMVIFINDFACPTVEKSKCVVAITLAIHLCSCK